MLRHTTAENSEADELAYVWAHLETDFAEFLNTRLPNLLKCTPGSEEACYALQDLSYTLESIFSLIQLPKRYKHFIYPINDGV